MLADDSHGMPASGPRFAPIPIPIPSQDPRAERTRQLIFAATRALMADRPASVSVGDIVRVAGISRSSFYAHFSNLDEVASELLRTQFVDIGSAAVDLRRENLILGGNAARIGYSRLIEHMVEHFPLYSSVLDLPLTRSVYDGIVSAYATQVLESVLAVDSVPAGVNPDLATTYIAGGTVALISAWMRGVFEASDDEIVEQLVAMLPPWLVDDHN